MKNNSMKAVRPQDFPDAVRQWLLFSPYARDGFRAKRLRRIRLLIEASDGRLAFVELNYRILPDDEALQEVVCILCEEDVYVPHSNGLQLLDKMGLQPLVLNEPIDILASWSTPLIISEATLDDLLIRTQRGERLDGSHRETFCAKINAEFSARLSKFISRLEVPIVQLISGKNFTPAIYNYLLGACEESSRNRIQAATAFPVLLRGLAAGHFPGIQAAIEEGRSLNDAIASSFKVSGKSVVRALRALDHETVSAWQERPLVLAKLLAGLPADYYPKGAATWGAFNTAVQAITQASGMPILSSRNRLYLRSCAARRFKVEGIEETLGRAARIMDEFTATLMAVLNFELRRTPGFQSAYAMNTVEEFINSKNDIFQFVALAERYEAVYLQECRAFANSEEKAMLAGIRWQGLLDTPFITPTRSIHQLTTVEELLDEGLSLNHCVGGYSVFCMSGDAVIFSIRDRSGKRLSTLHLDVLRDKTAKAKINFIQHKAEGNKDPTRECRMAALSLQRLLNENTEAIERYLAWRRQIGGLGKDARALAIMMRPMIAALQKVLPKDWPLEKLIQIARENSGKALP